MSHDLLTLTLTILVGAYTFFGCNIMQYNLAPNFHLGRSWGICVALAHILRTWKR